MLFASELFANTKKIIIIHEGKKYNLTLTKNNKLLLTK